MPIPRCRLALRRHDQWLAPATTPRDLGAARELQLLRQADPDTDQPLIVALDGHTLRREIWVCFDESSLDRGRRDVERVLQIGIFRRDFHHRARFAHGLQRGPLTCGRPTERRFAGCPDPRRGGRSLDPVGSRFPSRGEGEESVSVFRIARRLGPGQALTRVSAVLLRGHGHTDHPSTGRLQSQKGR